ncbi:MAG: hypothetical protein IAF38_09245 [Bacteroidia bacterium]|nr:hypothetical protein [Bacteroidia bacterium]
MKRFFTRRFLYIILICFGINSVSFSQTENKDSVVSPPVVISTVAPAYNGPYTGGVLSLCTSSSITTRILPCTGTNGCVAASAFLVQPLVSTRTKIEMNRPRKMMCFR